MKSLNKFVVFIIISAMLNSCSNKDDNESADDLETVSLPAPLSTDSVASFSEQSLLRLDGSPLEEEMAGGKYILLNYWATWCGPCIREIPSLINAQNELGDEFTVMLASDEAIEDIQLFIEENQFEAGNFVKLDGYFADYEIQAIPSTSLFNKDGQQIGSWLGAFEWDSPEIVAELKAMVH